MSRKNQSEAVNRQTEKFYWLIHFLVRSKTQNRLFKTALGEYRGKWLVPRALDDTLNPVLLRFPGAFDRVLEPFEHDKLAELMSEVDDGSSLNGLMAYYRRWAGSRQRGCRAELAAFAERVGARDADLDMLHRAAVDHAERTSQYGASSEPDRQALEVEWAGYPGQCPWLLATFDDLGECSCDDLRWLEEERRFLERNGCQPGMFPSKNLMATEARAVWAAPEAAIDSRVRDRQREQAESERKDVWEDSRVSKDAGLGHAWLNAGYAAILVHPDMTKQELAAIGNLLGVGSKKGKQSEPSCRARALRWMVVPDARRSELLVEHTGNYPNKGWGPKKWQQQVANELNKRYGLKQNKVTSNQVKSWTTRGGKGGFGGDEKKIFATFG